MTKSEELLARLERHEGECSVRYELINKQLDAGSKRFDRLEALVMSMYPFIVATIAIAEHNGPVYLRFGRPKVPNFTEENQKFTIGEGLLLSTGTDVSIIATGHLVWEALEAAKILHEQGISAEVIDIHTIKPLDEKIVVESAKKTGAVVSCEEHNFLGGLGESISRTLAMHHPTPQEFVATQDTFGESGTPAQLMEKYGLNAHSIVNATKRVIARK